MLKILIVALSAIVLLAQGAGAQSTCTPEKLTAAIDAYAFEPFGARAWRKMTGLGDPMIEASNPWSDSWQKSEDWRNLTSQLAPELVSLPHAGYNCRIGYPLSVLKDRVARYGGSSAYVRQWLTSQARVISACTDGKAEAITLPDLTLLPPEQAELMKQDHAYQQASIAFYVDKPKAVQLFRAIGASNSPHRAAARYNVANLLANARNIAEARAEVKAILADPSLQSVHSISEELDGYIANLEDTAEGWTALINRTVATVSEPMRAIQSSPDRQSRYAAALSDLSYVGVGAKTGDWWLTGTLPDNPTLSKALVDASRSHAIALWMMTGQTIQRQADRMPWPLMGPKWHAWTASLVDRALAVKPAGAQMTDLTRQALLALKAGSDQESRQLLWQQAAAAASAAAASCGEAPATAALSVFAPQAVRASFQAGAFDEIARQLPSLGLAQTQLYGEVILPALMRAVLASGKLEEGRGLRDSLALIQQAASMPAQDGSGARGRTAEFLALIAEDKTQWLTATRLQAQQLSSPLLNLQSSAELRDLARQEGWSAPQRALLLRAAWTRDFAKGKLPGRKLSEEMLAHNPEIMKTVDELKNEFPRIRDKDLWTLTILRNPRFGILLSSPDWTDPIETPREDFRAIDSFDPNDKNWWCSLHVDRHLAAIRKYYDEASGIYAVSSYHLDTLKPLLEDAALAEAAAARDKSLKAHPLVRSVDWREVQRLADVPAAPQLLSRQAISLAKSGRLPKAAPEALGRAVMTTRYGCRWNGPHGKYSKAAQLLLKEKFPESAWARRTPYWFDCMATTYDANFNRVVDCKPKSWPQQAPLR